MVLMQPSGIAAAITIKAMTSLTISNEQQDLLCVFVEPLGEDFWIAPSQRLRFTGSSTRPEIEVVWHAQGASIFMDDADAYGFEVRTDTGDLVECGYQRPLNAFKNST